ncbi:unnamed protein product [Effrenium voratum]|uniref:Uncharacterized protein n=1 Tax=Effrenium voratum TaxID=2562239 RepID=A0AA36N037_9DINO|nr:unnamed protein product [Effrenium voratum]CAJ1439367.1 unnamed protein product [Effrenium voratum]
MSGRGQTYIGDREQRVTVPLPRTIQELKGHAHKHFGAKHTSSNPLRMYHHGKVMIHHPNHMTNVKDEDVVVVTLGEDDQGPPPVSTHQAHFVPHPLQAKKPPAGTDGPRENVPFDGKSSYNVDYIPHPLQGRDSAKPPRDGWEPGKNGRTGKSTYAAEFPWHTAKPPEKGNKQAPPGQSVPFEGLSSYQHDYIKHPNRPRSASGRPRPKLPATGPFDGTTTYTTDYKKFQVPHARPQRLDARPSDPKPFEGSSEYRREYLKHPLSGPEVLHIEPELHNPHVMRIGLRPATVK